MSHTRSTRRDFIRTIGSSIAATTAAATVRPVWAAEGNKKPLDRELRLGVIGLGGRGRGEMRMVAHQENARVVAIAELIADRIKLIEPIAKQAGWEMPEVYTGSNDAYRKLLARDDLDAVIIATPWECHAPMAVETMNSGKYAAVEVPAALTIEECRQLVETSKSTGVPCMMMENWAFRRDNLAILMMIRQRLFGKIVHGHGSYSHDCMNWFFDPKGNPRWSGEHLKTKNTCQYLTHGVGPMIEWMDINRGDQFDYLTATSSNPLGIREHLSRKHGEDHPSTKFDYPQGDIVTTVIKTTGGKTLVLNNDLTLPRPYDNRWMIQGTMGIYNEQRAAVYLEGVSPKSHQWEPFAPYQEKYEHLFWKDTTEAQRKVSHGGTDFVMMREFLKAVRRQTQTPLDVYDSVAMSAINPLTARSIAKGSQPTKFPEFLFKPLG